MTDFMDSELTMIKNMALTKSHKQIAVLMGCEPADIAQVLSLGFEGIKTFQQKKDEQRAARPAGRSATPRPKKVRVPKKEVRRKENLRKKVLTEKKQRTNVEMEWRQQRTGNLNRERKFKDKEIDYSQQTSIRIDKKTIIYAKPGEDTEVVKAKFLKNYGKVLKLQE